MKPQLFGRALARALTLVSLALIVIGMASAIFGLAYSVYFHTPFPFRDMVETMEFLDTNPAIWLGESFTRLHDMEHRPALPAFIWYADRIVSGSSGVIPLIISHATLVATALLAVWNWAPRIDRKEPWTWLVPAAALAVMFSLVNWYNLIWEKQLHVSMSLLFITLSGHFAARLSPADEGSERMGARGKLLFAAFAAWAAEFSFGYGLPAMPVITIHGMLARWPLRYLAVSAVFSVIFIGAYYYFFSLGGRSLTGLTKLTFDPLVTIAYVARLLGSAVAATELNSFAGVERSTPPLIAGVVLLGLYIFGAARLYLRSVQVGQPPSSSRSVSLIVTSACLAIALMTWLSRPDETQGLVERYYIVSTFFVLSLPGLFVSAKAWARTKEKVRVGLVVLSSVLIVFSLLGHMANYTKPYLRWHASVVAAIGADMGIHFSGQDELIGPPLHEWKSKSFKVWQAHRLRLKERGRYNPFEWRGRNVAAVFDGYVDRKCVGSIERIEPVPGYESQYAFFGWARHGAIASTNGDWIVATYATGRIIGLGAPGRISLNGRKWLNDHFPDQVGPFPNHSGIAGYLSATPGSIVHFFTVQGNKACEFATIPVP